MKPENEIAEGLSIFAKTRDKLQDAWLDNIGHNVCNACAICSANHCCSQLVNAHALEGMIAAAVVLDLEDGPSVADVIAQGDAQYEIHKKYWSPALLETTDPTEREALIMAGNKVWYDRNEMCVFNVNGRCSIYVARPVACSTYYVRHKCQTKPAYHEGVEAANNTNVVLNTFAVADLIAQRMFDYDRNTGLIPLPFTYAVAESLRCIRDVHFGEIHVVTGAQA